MKNGNVNSQYKKPPTKMPSKNPSYLEGLKGKMVTLYRGGPESKSGLLLDVKPDYVALYAQNDQNENNNDEQQQKSNNSDSVIYYRLHHLKSISEDTKNNSTQMSDRNHDLEIDFLKGNRFADIINQHRNEWVQVNQGGPESKKGLLINNKNDYLVLYTEDDGIVYYNLHHIKSLCKVEMNQDDESGEQEEAQKREELEIPPYVNVSNFQEVFSHMSHKWVSINRGGPEALEGVLVESLGGHYTLVNNQEVIRISPYHIRNISSGPKGTMKQNNDNEEQDKNEQGNEEAEIYNSEDSLSHSKYSRRSHSRDSRRSYTTESKHSYARDSRRSHRRDSGRSYRSHKRSSSENVIKTIDYVWKV